MSFNLILFNEPDFFYKGLIFFSSAWVRPILWFTMYDHMNFLQNCVVVEIMKKIEISCFTYKMFLIKKACTLCQYCRFCGSLTSILSEKKVMTTHIQRDREFLNRHFKITFLWKDISIIYCLNHCCSLNNNFVQKNIIPSKFEFFFCVCVQILIYIPSFLNRRKRLLQRSVIWLKIYIMHMYYSLFCRHMHYGSMKKAEFLCD